MKSFTYTLAILLGALSFAQAASEKAAPQEEVVLEEAAMETTPPAGEENVGPAGESEAGHHEGRPGTPKAPKN